MRTFLLKAKHFFKRNIYPITVSFCTVLILTIVTVSAYTSIKNSSDVVVDTNSPSTDVNSSTNVGDNKEEDKDVSTTETIIFGLPFENATISKEYTDSTLLYDATTKLWCTHQGLDFACKDGQEVKAVFDGKIIKIENSMMNGTVVHLKVSDSLTVVYKGLGSNVSVKEGDVIKKGAKIGRIVGFLAEKADGVHLHLEVLKDKKLVDPTEYFSFSK